MENSGKKSFSVLIVVIVILVLVIGWFASSYNSLVVLQTKIAGEWSNVEVQYQRRADLVPQLVETVKGAANFEKGTLTAVTEARTQWLNAQSGASRVDEIAAANTFDSALSRLLVTVESYPALTATENFKGLQAQLEGTENRIAVARKNYNDSVLPYNTAILKFPKVFIAKLFGFDTEEYFVASDGSDQAPTVNFSN